MKTPQTVMVSLLTLALGGAGGYLIAQQQHTPAQGDVVFAQDMMTHHNQAIDMANRLYTRLLAQAPLTGTNEGLKYLTYDIITSQSNQNGQMLGWLFLWKKPASNPDPMDMQAMGMATPEQLEQLSTLPLNEARVLFLQLMVRHHQGGVMMAESALKNARIPVVKGMAEKIVQAQNKEIHLMTSMLKELGAEPLPDLAPMDHSGTDHSDTDHTDTDHTDTDHSGAEH